VPPKKAAVPRDAYAKPAKQPKGTSKSKGASRGGGDGGGPSEYQEKMRKRYKEFTRFLGGYFASERKEQASVMEILSHPVGGGAVHSNKWTHSCAMHNSLNCQSTGGTVLLVFLFITEPSSDISLFLGVRGDLTKT
jgi:hypothetical protein